MGAEILGLLLGGTSNIITNQTNEDINQAQMANQRELLGIQQNFSAQQARLADLRTRALYNDLQSPEAIRKQLEKAGLSVGMMYGQGGMGGSMQSGAQATSPGATGASVFGHTPLGMEAASILADVELKKAQAENIEADTNLKEEEIPVKKQTVKLLEEQTENAKQTTESIKQSIKNQIAEEEKTIADTETSREQAKVLRAQEKFIQAQEELMRIDIQTRGQLNWAQIYKAEAEIENLYESAKKGKIEREILEKSADAICRKYLAEAINLEFKNNNINEKELELLNQQIKEIDLKNQTEQEIRDSLERMAGGVGQAKGIKAITELLITIVKIIKSKK